MIGKIGFHNKRFNHDGIKTKLLLVGWFDKFIRFKAMTLGDRKEYQLEHMFDVLSELERIAELDEGIRYFMKYPNTCSLIEQHIDESK